MNHLQDLHRPRPCRPGPRRRKTAGFTLMEVIMAGFLVAIITSAATGALVYSHQSNVSSKLRLAAVNQAQALAEELHNIDYFRLAGRTTDKLGYVNATVLKVGDVYNVAEDALLSREVRLDVTGQDDVGTPVSAASKVYIYPPASYWSGSAWTTANTVGPTYKTAKVEFTWQFRGKTHTYATRTILSGLETYDIDNTTGNATTTPLTKKTAKNQKPSGNAKNSTSFDNWVAVDGD